MSDRICLMNDGRIEQLGTPNDLYFAPKSIFTALFLGGANMLPISRKGRDATFDVYEGPGESTIYAPRSETEVQPLDGHLSVMVRPEHIRLLRDGEQAENMLDLRIRDSVMVGPVTKYFGETSNNCPVTFTELTTSPTRSASAGDLVRIGWPAARSVVLPGRSEGHE